MKTVVTSGAHDRHCSRFSVAFGEVMATLKRHKVAKSLAFPIHRGNSKIRLLISSLHHENPILARCRFTFFSSAATLAANSGNGVSYRSANSFTRWVKVWLIRSISP